MPDVFASGHARRSTMLLFSFDLGTMDGSTPEQLLRVSASRVVAGRWLRLVVDAVAGETKEQLGARATDRLDELAAIAETVEQPWPRCDGETPSEAHHWLAEGFVDAEVVAWLELGVYASSAAAELRAVHLEPRDVAGELADGVTLGLAFARRELTLAEVQRLVVGKEVG